MAHRTQVRKSRPKTARAGGKRPLDRSYWLRMLNSGPTVLVSSAFGGRRTVIAVAWATPASIEPPLVIVSIGLARGSHAIVRGAREFVINIPAREQLALVRAAGTLSSRRIDKFVDHGMTPESAVGVSVPRVAECPAHIECRVVRTHRCGDHTLFVGEVVGAFARADFFSNRLRVEGRAKTVHHLGGSLFHLPGRIVSMMSGAQ